jgi:glucose/arabinose dehydrogenase
MATRLRWLFPATFVTLFALLSSASTFAHPAFNPYDATRFAPVTRFGPMIGVEVLTSGLVAPLKGVTAPGHPNHLFVIDQPGVLHSINLTTGARTAILDVRSRIVTLGVCGPDTFDERGLLGIAFHPRYQQNGLLYTYTSEPNTSGTPTLPTFIPGVPDHHNVIAEWRVPTPGNPIAAVDPISRRELVRVAWPQFNHNGGDMAFGHDGMLYFSMGDGGSADDADGQPFITGPHPSPPVCRDEVTIGHQGDGNAQKLNTPLGKVLRIDVNPPFTPGKQYRVPADNPFVSRPGAVAEIWAFGFRNPWRFSFDRRSGALFLGNVGQNDIEEVELVVRGGNYGWNLKEGTLFFHINGSVPDDGVASRDPDPTRGPIPPDLIDPIAQYDTHHEGHSVIGGFVYHGRAIPQLRQKYVFGEFALVFRFPFGPHDSGRLFTINPGGEHGLREISQLLVVPGGALHLAVLGMGQDADGELYVTGNISGVPFGDGGRVLRLVPAPETDD